ncbi:MAG: cytochrome ubiquinol oxidase subunit I [Chloroflexi bacterium]|nr:cytochrome ubiquinol oxidase subunit I [Chloroflexota bacterium]
MDALSLARWQFAATTIYHFFFVPLTLGLSLFVALLETQYVRSGNEIYRRMAKFWGNIFLINFALGVVTGLVQEFQFGMNWSEYSRFMGDIFGAPLAIEALLAFYMESTFIGVWVFGWNKLPKKVHLASAWLVALGSNISSFWILVANSFMQRPTGYRLDPETGRALMADFFALVTNPNVFYQFTHVITAGIAMAGFVVMGFSAWHLLRKHQLDFFRTSFRWAAWYGLIGSLLVGTIGHYQGQFLVREQPMKMAAAEALWETEAPAAFSLFAIPDSEARTNRLDIRIPALLSFLAHNDFSSPVVGINDLEKQFIEQYGPGDYIPPVGLDYWSFRIMVYSGLLMIGLAALAVYYKRPEEHPRFLKTMMWATILPYLGVTFGWVMAETGRWPWIVYGLLKIEDAVSPNVPASSVLFSMTALTILYLILAIIGVGLALRYGLRYDGYARDESRSAAY